MHVESSLMKDLVMKIMILLIIIYLQNYGVLILKSNNHDHEVLEDADIPVD